MAETGVEPTVASVTVREAVTTPAAVGLYTTLIVQVAGAPASAVLHWLSVMAN
jgi:acetoacetate decarboxylase